MKENSLKAQLLVKSILKNNPPKEMTLLSLGQVQKLNVNQMWLYHSSEEPIDVIDKVGKLCEMTDYALIQNTEEKTIVPPNYLEENNYSKRYGSYFLKTITDEWQTWYVDASGNTHECFFNEKNIGIRPVLVCPELKKIKDIEILHNDVVDLIKHPKANYPKDVQPLKVKYGYFPQKALTRDEIRKYDGSKTVILADNIPTTNNFIISNIGKSSNYKPYEKKIFLHNTNKYIIILNTNDEYVRLSNQEVLEPEFYSYVKLLPLEWYVDFRAGALISTKIFDSKIPFNLKDRAKSFEDTFMYRYLNDILLKEITTCYKKENVSINTEPIIIPEQKKKENTNSETKKIYQKIDEINEIIPYYHKDNDIDKQIENIINDYNNSIDNLILNNRKNIININQPSKEMILNETLLKLDNILNDLKKYYANIKNYLDMLEVVNKLTKILVQDDRQSYDDDLMNLFSKINNTIPYINLFTGEDYKKEFINILSNYRNEIEDCLKNKTHNTKYKTIDELDMCIRESIHPLLLTMDKIAKRKDLIEEINNFTKEAMKNNFKKREIKSLKNLLTNINEVVQRIHTKANGEKYYIDQLNNILNIIITQQQQDEDIYEKLENTLRRVSRLERDLDEELETNNYKIRLNYKKKQ